ncbi:MAG TPA: response regulator [Planctomycetota bacterium]|nr:response regulator [Planctomycetota bacterium]
MTKLLVVEDDPNQRRLYEQELEDEGYTVCTAAGGKEALAEISKERPDLVIMDISMPGMDGIEALGKVLGVDNTIPVILNTAYANYKDNFLSWAADAYVVKSSDLTELKETIKSVIKKRAEEGKK